MSEKRRYAPANAPSVGYAILLIPRARVPIASLMCCCNAGERSSELLYVLKMRQRPCNEQDMRPFSLVYGAGWGPVAEPGYGLGLCPSGGALPRQLGSPWARASLDPR